jgi:hypothetical protein
MTERFPGYDVLAKRWTESWDQTTRRVIDRRLAIARKPRFFSAAEWQTLSAVCERIMPQPEHRAPVPLPAFVDQKMADGMLDGYRYASLPPQGDAWRRGLAALDEEARAIHGEAFHGLLPAQQDDLLHRMQRGALNGAAWGGMPCKLFFEYRVIPDIVHAYYAHPVAWNEIGFSGPASPRGHVRLGLNRRDPWDPVEAPPETGHDPAGLDRARRKNTHVG